ncbi:two-component sensor histidine kinase [Rhodobacteraceae bacterium NNCM2]|nr:two-component sensor histidine kinase [Coraliihabitans acroporae]
MLSAGKFLKPYLPNSLFGRAFLILVVPILLLQAVVAIIFIQRHYDGVTEQMAASVAREINFAIDTVDNSVSMPELQTMLMEIGNSLDMTIGLDEGALFSGPDSRSIFDLTGSVIADTLRQQIRNRVTLDFQGIRKHVDVRIDTSRGVLRVLVPRRRMNASNPHLLLVWMIVTAVALTGVATAFLRNQVKPIRDLAKTATAFGLGRSVNFRPSGAEEVRRAGHAFLDMRNRIERQMEQRTRMLSGVSHDLRTPLTRMRLALAVAEQNPETDELVRDVEEMEHMLEAFLSFARGEDSETSEPCSPVDLAREVADNARREGHSVTLYTEIATPDKREVVMRRAAIKRCLTNLVGNAAAYGTKISLTTRLSRRFMEYVVEDDGPGIPPEKREEVLRPFTRLDESRNQNIASGVGLGLSIALDAVRSHGGSLRLGESERLGGLSVSVILPR